MFASTTQSSSESRGPDAIRRIFREYGTELEEFAFFLTGNDLVANACVVEACRVAESETDGCHETRSMEWARHRTLRATLEMQQPRIQALASLYELRFCGHRHTSLTPELLEFVVEETPLELLKLDTLSRCVLVLCGVEKQRFDEVAALLKVSRLAVRAAYCNALEWVEILHCERLRSEDECAAISN